ncbi:MAG TPA: tyrosinase family protein [Thermoanaerobaculia bacterium]|nr:tyrosinase family protein [Thermoanaerobaculia bacterium]
MAISRRSFVRQTLYLGPVAMAFWIEKDVAWAWAGQCGLPVQGKDCTLPDPGEAKRFVPNEPKVQTRYSAREMAQSSMATQLQQFRDAICKVRDLPPDDVISWTKLVAQHCINCASSNTNNIHYNWQFLPWHRGLLYFLERSLRKLSGHDDLRLVYWDWESSQSRTLPSIYAPPDQPLYWANRKLDGPRWPLKDSDVDVQPSLAVPDFARFGGTSVQRQPVPIAYSGPHAPVHNAFSPGDMANLQFSPRDPVFYAHHGNIDRLWSSWVAAGHKNPDFGDAKVYFYDENRVWSYVLMNDLRDETKLGYKYSSLMQPRVRVSTLQEFSAARSANRVTLAAPTLRKVRQAGPDFLLIRNIQNLERLPESTVDFGIFHGAPAVGTQAEGAPGFLGKVSRVLSESHNHPSPLSAALNVTDRLGGMAPERDGASTLELTVAPLDDAGKTSAEAIPLVAEDVSVVG